MSTAIAENAGLGPCDLDPVWPKMSAVAAAGVNKKRKKPEAKPQSQINKCLNEKRRREQENIYIEELAELISASFADMSSLSVKPDKCAILQETVNQIRTIKQQEVSVVTSDAVQQGEVSSSKPTILTNEAFAPLLLEALDGFLFVVNTEGKIEYVTENVSQFIKFTKEEILGKSIYNIIHLGDHARFSSCLLPMSVGWTPLEPHSSSPQQRNRSFNCRLLVKPPDDQDETMEEKQTRVSKYETMQISSTQLPYPGEKSSGGGSNDGSSTSGGEVTSDCSEVGPCLMCVARRIPVEKPNQIGATCEQFTMKLDISGKIIGVDTSGVSSTYSQYLNKDLMNRTIQELCHGHDLQKLLGHLKEALSAGHSTSAIYRLRVSGTQDKYIHVQTKSKLFKCSGHELDFIMATHSIIGDNDIANLDTSVTQHLSNNQSSSSSVGGPLMCSVNDNNSRSISSSDIGNTITLNTNSAFHTLTLTSTELSLNEFELFPQPSFDLMPATDDRVSWEQPEPRQPLTPAPSPLTSYAPPQPSPVATTPFQPTGTPFPFSPLQDTTPPLEETKDSKEGIIENSTTGESLDSGRLRSLLTTKRPSTDSEEGGGSMNRNNVCILKSTLSQDDDDDRPAPPSSDPPTPKVSSGNNMLLKLLNEKNDDDDLEAKVGLKKQNELLQQLLKDNESKTQHHQADDPLLKSLGFHTGSPSPPEGPGRARKRPSEEGEDGSGASGQSAKRGPLSALETLQSPPVSSTATGNSKLWEKNKMLASLLAKQPSTPTTIPPIPASVISATPQDKLPRLIKQPISSGNTGWSGGTLQQSSTTSVSRTTVQMTDSVTRQRVSQSVAAQNQRTTNHVPTSSQFLHSVIDQQQQQQQQLQQQQQQQQQQQAQQQARVSFDYRTNQATHDNWDLQSSDPLLSELLDQVIDIVPDAIITDSSAIMNILDAIESPATSSSSSTTSGLSFQQDINEKMAINAIQKSLMLCESAMKSPIYNTTTMASNQQQFPPPPMYQQRPRFSLQQSAQLGVRPGTPQYAMANQQQQLLIQHRSKLLQQQQQKQRLLQQQQQQQLLIPSNAAANADPGLHNIDSLINNTVAPNVSLQRSSSVPDSQLSPSSFNPGSGTGGTGNILNSGGAQISPSQRQPYSPLSHQQAFSPVNGSMNSFQQQPAQQQQQQPQANVQARLSPSGLPPFQQAQLSPRVSQSQQQQQAYTVMSQANTWSQQTNRLSLQQQQNPMLNAQLTGGTYNTNRSFVTQQRTGQQQLPPVRSLTSPGSRQSPFPPEVSPTTAASYQQPTGNQYRLQRTISAPPQATTQLPGGVRHYAAGLSKDHHPLLSPSYPTHPVMYPHPPDSPQFCFDQSTLQLYGASCDRSRLPGGGNNGMTEYVRQEIRAMVGARTGGAQGRQPPQQIQVAPGQQVSPAELEALGLTFEMPNTGGSESPKLWGNVGSELSAVSPQPGLSRTNMEEVSRSSDQKSSLLQKLLSE